jgi:antitoxin (DNA-binding transcriptional repressor) of toxin-antitoxin stability system
LLDRVSTGEEVIITRSGKPVARLVPCGHPERKPGALKGKIWISPDFDNEDKEIEALFYEGGYAERPKPGYIHIFEKRREYLRPAS